MSEVFKWDGVEYTLPFPGGLTFESKDSAYQLCVRDETPIYDHGVRVGTERALVAEFGDMNAPVIHNQDTGEEYFQVRGNFIDTYVQGVHKNWTDDERAMVEKKLLSFQRHDDHWLHTKPPVAKPWPTYDDTPAAKVAELATTLGLVPEAVAYEAENKNRSTVLSALRGSKTVDVNEYEAIVEEAINV